MLINTSTLCEIARETYLSHWLKRRQFFESIRNLAWERIIEESHPNFNVSGNTQVSPGELLKTANIRPNSWRFSFY